MHHDQDGSCNTLASGKLDRTEVFWNVVTGVIVRKAATFTGLKKTLEHI